MRHFAKKARYYTRFTLIGLFALAFPVFMSLQAQTFSKGRNSGISNVKQIRSAPSLLVADGFAVVTSNGLDDLGNGVTVMIVDISQFGGRWAMHTAANPTHSPEYIHTPGLMPLVQSWTTADFQNQRMRGLALSSDGNTIYVSVHGFSGVANRPPNIYRILAASSTTPTLLSTTPLPGTLGIGGIDLAERHKSIYASNIDDGKIYRLSSTTPGAAIDSFDPLTLDASGNGVPPPLGERVIAVAYHRQENRLYYSVWGYPSKTNTIRSVALNNTGGFTMNTDRLEINLPGSVAPVGDIEFNRLGTRMLLAEEPVSNSTPLLLSSHNGRGLEYVKSATGYWSLDPVVYGTGLPKYEIGRYNFQINSPHNNTRGGVTWVYSSPAGNHNNGNEHFTLWTGDALRYDSNVLVYGLQFTPSSGGSAGSTNPPFLLPSNSLIADLDYNVSDADKSVYGDVDIRRVSSSCKCDDFDGDGGTDVSVFRPSNGYWYIRSSSNGGLHATQFGTIGDLITPADYDGDGKTDIGVFRPSNGTWYRLNSTNNTFSAAQFGSSGDVPNPADYDGDGRVDITVYRPSAGSWYRLNSSDSQFIVNQFGNAEDKPVIGDFDGDGKSDLALFRPSNGTWYRINSSDEFPLEIQFGTAEDKPVPADYDGDGKSDLALFRPSNNTWYRTNSGDGSALAEQFGAAGDVPVPGDYDGDGENDLAVFRPSAGDWHVLRSTEGLTSLHFGANGDIPTPSAFIR